MNNKYKYSVVTTIFGNYENVKEVINPQKDVEYVLVTDNPKITSKTWTVKVFNDYDKLPFPEVAWVYIKFFVFNYCSSNVCLYKDGSIQIKDDFSRLVEYFVNNNYEYGIVNESNYFSPIGMLEQWAENNYYGFNKDSVKRIVDFFKTKNYDVYSQGLCTTSFILKQNTFLTKQIDECVWNTMCEYSKKLIDFRLIEPVMAYSLHKYMYDTSKLAILDYNLLWSPWFEWHFHKSNRTNSFNIHQNKYVLDVNYKFSINNKIIDPITYHKVMFPEKPLLTVVITSFNKEKTIKRAINSVKQINYDNWECIIVDNDSEDNSFNIILECTEGDNRFTVVRQKNKNLCNSRNTGAFLGKGKYLIHLDGDDTMSKNYCRYCIDEMEKDDNICIGTGWMKRDYDGHQISFIPISCMYNTMTTQERMKQMLYVNPFSVTSVIRMSIFKSINGFREGLEYTAEDVDMFMRYFYEAKEKSKVCFVYDECTVIMYDQENSKSKNQLVHYKNFEATTLSMYNENKEMFEELLTQEEIDKIIKNGTV